MISTILLLVFLLLLKEIGNEEYCDELDEFIKEIKNKKLILHLFIPFFIIAKVQGWITISWWYIILFLI